MADLTITPANVTPKGAPLQLRGLAGVAVNAGQMVYQDPADAKFKLADCDSATLAARSPAGMAMNNAAANQPLVVVPAGDVNVGTALTAGTTYYLSPVAGGICPLADVLTGDSPVIVGIARSTSVLRLAIVESGVTL